MSTLNIGGMAMWIIITAFCFSQLYTAVGAKEFLQELILGLGLNRWVIVMGALFILFILGMFLSPGAIIMLTAPTLYPIITSLGFDPVWFSVLFVILLEMGYITPPFGFNLFFMKSVAPKGIELTHIYKAVWPFVGALWLGVFMVMAIPQLATWLPNVIAKY